MTGHYTAQHRLVGYDPVSERPKFSLDIPQSKFSVLRMFVRFGEDDPHGYDSYKLSYSQVTDLVKSLRGAVKPPSILEYFVEPFDPRESSHHRRQHHL